MNDAGWRLVADAAALAELCAALGRPEWIALDTEFLRERTYYPRLCLIQVAVPGLVACIDPLAIDDLGCLLDLLYDPAVTKVVHAAYQDMEIFYHLRGEVPAPLFDTQVAAPLLGHNEQIGYANLVRERLGVELGKAHTRTDWCRRPLSPGELRYAADDVRYLAQLYPPMRQALAERGRLEWLEADFAALADPATYRQDPADAWRRQRGAAKLKGPVLSVYQALCAWREAEAQRLDKPRKWLMSDDVLMSLARLKADSVKDLARVRGLQKSQLERYGETWLALMCEARGRRPQPLERGERPAPLGPAQEALVDLLMGVVKLIAAENELHPGVLASRKDLEKLVRGERSHPLMKGWRLNMAGERLLEVLEGRAAVRVENGHLVMS